jgi:hypothetical protein
MKFGFQDEYEMYAPAGSPGELAGSNLAKVATWRHHGITTFSPLVLAGFFLFILYRLSCWIFGIKPSGKDFAKWTILGILLSIFFGK